MKQLKYQQKAIAELIEKSIPLLNTAKRGEKLIFKAPTGSGKTVMAFDMLSQLVEELHQGVKSDYREVAFIWIAPNKLHEQSYMKMKHFFDETRVLRPVMYDELDHTDGYIHAGEILFVNWESINKENAIMVRESELNKSLFEITRRTQEEHNLPIVVIIDEEHLFWSKTADKSAQVLKNINPKLEIRISATPKTQSYNVVNVQREDVVREEMIKECVILNPDLDDRGQNELQLNEMLIDKALTRRNQIAEAYKRLGVDINPLLLIQLPNDTSETLTVEDQKIIEQVKTVLDVKYDIKIENQRLAIWLSKIKENLDGLEEKNSLTDVLLFKQAIALGWDCPRAAVLLIFRKLNSNEFTIQTVGRILRMPEQHFYSDSLLNKGYVYTDVSRDRIQIVADDMEYLQKNILCAVRRDNIINVELPSVYHERKSSDRNRLGPDFKRILSAVMQERWLVSYNNALFTLAQLEGEEDDDEEAQGGETVIEKNRRIVTEKQHINLNVRNIVVEIIHDVEMQNEVGVVMVEGEHKMKYARTANEISLYFVEFCRSKLGAFERSHSTSVLEAALLDVMENTFGIYETDAKKVILAKANQAKFSHIIQMALERYKKQVEERKKEAKKREMVKYNWSLPEERVYNADNNKIAEEYEEHALLPFVQQNNASNPEREFERFLEENKDYIEWWYKNGDEGKQHYSIQYENSSGEIALFYVDFVVRMKNEQLFLFDTKTAGFDPETVNKHNALIDYIAENRELNLRGGVLIQNGGNWMYSPMKIENTEDIVSWNAFYPQDYKN